jgi:ATP-dependent Clp protease ATP-binding subunit ClpB
MDLLNSISDQSKIAILIAQKIAKEFQNENYSAPHLLKALLHEDVDLVNLMERMGKDINYMKEWADIRIENAPKTSYVPEAPSGDRSILSVFKESDIIRLKFSKDEIDPVSLMAAICMPNVAFSADQLKSFNLNYNELIDFVLTENALVESISGPQSAPVALKNTSPGKGVLKFCIDKTTLAREGKLDPIVGRDEETRIITEILSRRKKTECPDTWGTRGWKVGVGRWALHKHY